MSTDLSSVTLLVLTTAFGFGIDSARAEGGEQPPAQYVSLPAGNDIRTQPRAGAAFTSGGGVWTFEQQVARGAVTMRPRAPANCLPGSLRAVVADVAAKFGAVSLESTHRTQAHNGRAGGARHSLHLSCRAIDLRVRARSRGLMAYLRSRPEVGGLKIYRTGIIHIDNGQRRTW